MQNGTGRTTKIRELNDTLRTTGNGGQMFITKGVLHKGKRFVFEAINAMRLYDDFSKDNDPWSEHDFGSVTVDGEKVFWKIDYYSTDLKMGSEDPSDQNATSRVLTIMLAAEY